MTKQTAFEKFSKTHRSTCRVNVFSGDRKCTCGRDQAIRDQWDMERDIQGLLDLLSIAHGVMEIEFSEDDEGVMRIKNELIRHGRSIVN